MAQTYTMRLNSFTNKPDVAVTLPNIPEDKIRWAMDMATQAYRGVEVVADETGEVIFNYYVDIEFHNNVLTHGEMIDILCAKCYNQD